MADKKATTAADIHKLIKEKDVKYVDIRFTDPKGKWQHVTFDLMMVDDDFLNTGTMFDGSSIAGWKAINESDMLLKPDLETAVIDPFFAQTTLILICDVLEQITNQNYARCPRSIAKAAEAYVNSSGIGDLTYFGPEAEFFVFDDVRFGVEMNKCFYYVNSKEGAYNTGTEYEGGNLGHRPAVKGGYFPVPPVDHEQDMRGEMLAIMRDMGINPEKHHHEVATAQHELGFNFNALTKCGDYIAQAKPEDKLARIRKEQEGGKLIAMIGDGTNDAPALAQADVGVAMNTGTQAAREAGNMVDLDSNPTKLIEVVEIGKQLLMTRGALTTFSIANDVSKYFAILPAMFGLLYATTAGGRGPLDKLNIVYLHSPQSAILARSFSTRSSSWR